MDEALHNEDLLVQYLDGELNQAEKMAFERRLQIEPQLREQLTTLQIALQAVKQFGTTQQVSAIHQEMMEELRPKKAKVFSIGKTVRYSMAVAASILILFIGVRLYLGAQISSENLYDDSFVDFTISSSRGANTAPSEIEKSYQQKNYDAVVSSTRSIQLDAKDSLLIGLSYLHKNNLNSAINFFQRIASTPNDFQQDGEFYLSLSYLKNKSYDKALVLMQKIAADPFHIYHDRFSNDFIEKVKELKNK